MGAWGTAIFADDVAADVRDDWREAILEGLDADEATRRVVDANREVLGDDDEAKIVWLALALAQHETGRLQAEVRDRALAIVAAGGDVARWAEEDAALARQRAAVLDRLAAKLAGPQPAPKKLRRPRRLGVEFDVGDAILVRNDAAGARALFAVIDNEPGYRGGPADPVVAPLLWTGARVPPPHEIERLPVLLEDRPAPLGERPSRIEAIVYTVLTARRDTVFGPRYGEVVAKGLRLPRIESARDSSCGWDFLQAWIAGESYRRRVAETPRLMTLV